jgi:sec-independent protein translocase protein TatA
MILFLNDIAGSEVLLILFFILIFFGSKSIPGIARTFGKTIREIKDASSDLQREIKKTGSEWKNELNINQLIEQKTEEIQKPFDQVYVDVENVISYDNSNHSSTQNIASKEIISDQKDTIENEKELDNDPEKVS